jgi:hypothetical protein
MAYKFQVGDAIMSGSLTQEEGIVTTTMSASAALSGESLKIDSTTRISAAGAATLGASTVTTLSSSGAAQFASLGLVGNRGAAGEMLLGNGSGYQAAAMSGDATITGVGALTIANDAVTLAKMANLASANFILGNGSNEPSAATMSGDATMTNAGAVTIADNAVTLAKMAGLARGSIIYGDASGDPANLAKGASGTLLQSDGTDVSYVAVSGDATIAAGGALTIAANAVEGSMINANAAGAGLGYAASALAVQCSGAVQIASDKVGLSGSVAGAGLTYTGGVDSILTLEVGAGSLIDVAADQIDVDLTEAAAATIADQDQLIFLDGGATGAASKGSTRDLAALMAGVGLAALNSGLTLDFDELVAATIDLQTDSVAFIDANDSNITKKESWGDVTTAMASQANGGLTVEATTKKLMLDFNDLAAVAVDVAADSVGIYDNDGAVTGKESIVDLVAAMAGPGLTASAGQLSAAGSGDSISVSLVGDSGTLAAGLNRTATQTGAISVALPSVAASNDGDVVIVKGNSGTSTVNKITVARADSDTIDGSAVSLVLESPFAAVTLVYSHTGTNWHIC